MFGERAARASEERPRAGWLAGWLAEEILAGVRALTALHCTALGQLVQVLRLFGILGHLVA